MQSVKCLELKIERVRSEMYEAYNQSRDYETLLRISEELDGLLNKLEDLKNRHDDSI